MMDTLTCRTHLQGKRHISGSEETRVDLTLHAEDECRGRADRVCVGGGMERGGGMWGLGGGGVSVSWS